MKVLVVDDDQAIASIIQMMLEAEGLEVQLALNGAEGYSRYLQFSPELVITDIQMPGENGFELMEHIRAHNPKIKAIYISGDLNRYYALLEEEKTKYPINYLEKPFTRKELLSRVSEFMELGPKGLGHPGGLKKQLSKVPERRLGGSSLQQS